MFSFAERITQVTLLCLPFTKGQVGKELYSFSPENLNSGSDMIRGEMRPMKVSAELHVPHQGGMKSGRGTGQG